MSKKPVSKKSPKSTALATRPPLSLSVTAAEVIRGVPQKLFGDGSCYLDIQHGTVERVGIALNALRQIAANDPWVLAGILDCIRNKWPGAIPPSGFEYNMDQAILDVNERVNELRRTALDNAAPSIVEGVVRS